MKKTLIIIALLLFSFFTSGYKKPDYYTIDSEKNAYIHNNKGLYYIRERMYYPAIEEFKNAISLSPDTQATAVFYNNLGQAYMAVGRRIWLWIVLNVRFCNTVSTLITI